MEKTVKLEVTSIELRAIVLAIEVATWKRQDFPIIETLYKKIEVASKSLVSEVNNGEKTEK